LWVVVQVTRLAGVFGPAMAEYVMLHVLALERGYLRNAERQKRKEWGVR
jgi:phosphoglycerate dehydrogenase-like enzyme